MSCPPARPPARCRAAAPAAAWTSTLARWGVAALGSLLLGACTTLPNPAADQGGAVTPADVASAPLVAQAASTPLPAAAASAPAAPENAQAAGTPSDPLRPEEPVDLADLTAQRDLWVRVRRGFAIPNLDTDLVRNREEWYATRPDYVERMTERSSRYLFHIVEEVERRGLPTELALLPFIESAFNPQALSSAKASGMWQFMSATGRDYELTQNIFRDERRDVLASTRAALDYLERLHGMFGDWHLALAAYNWGEGSVSRAIARNEKRGLPTDYLSLSMPAETRYYVPKLQAVENIVADPASFGLALNPIENHPYFLSVPIQRDIDVDLVAKLAGLELKEFHALNPSLNKPVILAAGTPQLLLPYDNANLFVRALPDHVGPLASWTAWVVPTTMAPADAAKRVGMSEAQLREINRIPPRMLVRTGSTLLVPRGAKVEADVSSHLADNATMQLAPVAPPLRRTTVKVRKNETVAMVASRLGLDAASVARWNKLSTASKLKAGQSLVVYMPGKAATKRRTANTPTKRATATASTKRRSASTTTTKQRSAAAGGANRSVSKSKP